MSSLQVSNTLCDLMSFFRHTMVSHAFPGSEDAVVECGRMEAAQAQGTHCKDDGRYPYEATNAQCTNLGKTNLTIFLAACHQLNGGENLGAIHHTRTFEFFSPITRSTLENSQAKTHTPYD